MSPPRIKGMTSAQPSMKKAVPSCSFTPGGLNSALKTANVITANAGVTSRAQAEAASVAPNASAGFIDKTFDVTFAYGDTLLTVSDTHYGLAYAVAGSTKNMALDISFEPNGGRIYTMRPGDVLRYSGAANLMIVRKSSNAPITEGIARLVLFGAPGLEYEETILSQGSIAGGSYAEQGSVDFYDVLNSGNAQAYNSLFNRPDLYVGPNGPTVVGVPIDGVTGVRVSVNADEHNKIEAGFIYIWWLPYGNNPLVNWAITDKFQALIIDAQNSSFEFDIKCPRGFIFPECRSFETDTGNGAPTVSVLTWGV